jgi:ComF family protein
MSLRATAGRIASLVLGGSCFLCRGGVDRSGALGLLCAACRADLPPGAAEQCPRCALASPAAQVCGACLANAPRYDRTIAALEYRFPADALLRALKFRGELALAPLLAQLLEARIGRLERADLLVPVPLAAARLRERGFNHALEIARPLAAALRVPLEPALCERIRDTAPQTDLPLEGRARNVRGAFRCARSLDGATVAVLDDVMTTGATLDEVAAALKRAGASQFVNWVVARTPAPGSG